MTQPILIGRQSEQKELNHLLNDVLNKKGKLVLVAGEAGMGKTRLVEECLKQSRLLMLKTAISETATPSYGPIVAVLRQWLRVSKTADFAQCESLTPYLATLLPELGPVPAKSDQNTLFEAIRCALSTIAHQQPTAVFLDDLQWADNATLELLPTLVDTLKNEPLILIGTYRSDEIPRGHPMRRLRLELRRARQLQEIVVEPLSQVETGQLAQQILGETVSHTLISMLYDRTQGMPLFVEELAATLGKSNHLQPSSQGLELIPGEDIPVPDTLRDAILLRLDGLPENAVQLLEIAAVVGLEFDLELVIRLAGSDEDLAQLVERGLIVETKGGQAAFRHTLAREAIYEEIMWTRRRHLHRQLAEHLESQKAAPELVAEHWLAGRELDKARESLLLSTQRSCQIHAYRDAAVSAQRALELWPEGEAEGLRLKVLDNLGNCAQISGMLADAARAWREVADGWREREDKRPFAQVQQRLATVYELQGNWERALAARQAAADAFAASNMPAEAARERLSMAGHLQGEWHFQAAMDLVLIASEEAKQAERPDLIARALGIKGHVTAKMGRFEAGLKMAQTALDMALEHNLSDVASDIYFRLAGIYQHSANYGAAQDTFVSAIDYCDARGLSAMSELCLACMAFIMVQTGEWQRGITICRNELLRSDADYSRMVSGITLGMIYTYRGEAEKAYHHIIEATAIYRQHGLERATHLCTAYLARVNELKGEDETAVTNYKTYLESWLQWEEYHYVLENFRWAVTFFARRGDEKEVQLCIQELSQIVTRAGHAEALASLAHGHGEMALLNNDTKQAVQQFKLALNIFADQLAMPFWEAKTSLRTGVALCRANQREEGIEHIVRAYKIAKQLDARPLAAEATEELARIGESITKHLSPRAARRIQSGGLTRRQLEVLRHIALGKTNSEIADELTLSTRTVDMHVSNILNRLDCRTRAEAVRKAGELELLA